MKAYVQRLVARLCEADRPLSRNKHFHTFANADGREALRISRRLRSLIHDILAQAQAGESIRVEPIRDQGRLVKVLVEFVRLKAHRTAYLTPEEYGVLMAREDVRRAVEGDKAA